MKIALIQESSAKNSSSGRVFGLLKEIFPDAECFSLDLKSGFAEKFRLNRVPQRLEMMNFADFDLVISVCSFFLKGLIVPLNTIHICYFVNHVEEYFSFSSLNHQTLIWDSIASKRPDFYFTDSLENQKRLGKFYALKSEVLTPPLLDHEIENAWQKQLPSENKNIRELIPYYLMIIDSNQISQIDNFIYLFNKIEKNLLILVDGNLKNKNLLKKLKVLKSLSGNNVKFIKYIFDDIKFIKYLKDAEAYLVPPRKSLDHWSVLAMKYGKWVLSPKGMDFEIFKEIPWNESYDGDEKNFSVSEIEDALGRLIVNKKLYENKNSKFSEEDIFSKKNLFSKENFQSKLIKKIKELCGEKAKNL